jgi:hypothetical protein
MTWRRKMYKPLVSVPIATASSLNHTNVTTRVSVGSTSPVGTASIPPCPSVRSR